LGPLKRLRGIFLMGAATPPCPRRGLRLSLQLFSMPPCPAKDVGHGKPGGRAPESRSLSPWAPWERAAEGRVRVMASCLSPPDLSLFSVSADRPELQTTRRVLSLALDAFDKLQRWSYERNRRRHRDHTNHF